MSGDYSRDSFDALRDFAGVFLQQGRAVLDADWNEMVELFERRIRASTVDTIGRCVVPRETLTGFKVQLDGAGSFAIGRGRLYLDGMLLECHGQADFDGSDVNLPDPVFDRGRDVETGPEGVLDEFRDMVKAFHAADIEVILDVVYNHTAEGSVDGPTFGFLPVDFRSQPRPSSPPDAMASTICPLLLDPNSSNPFTCQ